jgi:hypothetical protein
MSSTDLAPRSSISAALDIPQEHREAISQYLGIEADDPALPAYLAICEQYELSPFLGQIWLIETNEKIRDGEGRETNRKRKRPAAGRDGYLAIAQRTGLLKGVQSDVVCEHDTFEVDWGVEPEKAPIIRHSYSPTEEDRGNILGAWAKTYRVDAYPTFYFARLKEHGKFGTNSSTGEKYWKSAWAYTSGMILKSAQSMALRIAFSITGVTPVDEQREGEEPVALIEEEATIPWPEDPAISDRLRSAVYEANLLEPNRYGPAVLQMMLGGKSPDELAQLAAQIEADNEQLASERGEEVADAEVVPDDLDGEQAQVRIDKLGHAIEDLRTAADDAELGADREHLLEEVARAEAERSKLVERHGEGSQ